MVAQDAEDGEESEIVAFFVSQGNGAQGLELGVVEEKNYGESAVVVDEKQGEVEVGKEDVVAELALAGDGLVELILGDEVDVLREQVLDQGGDDVQNDVGYV